MRQSQYEGKFANQNERLFARPAQATPFANACLPIPRTVISVLDLDWR